MGRKSSAKDSMKLGIVIPLWKREALTRMTLRRCLRALKGDRNCILVAVTDEHENERAAREYGFEVVPFPNQPLSDKKNAGVAHLRGRVDGVVFLGSDDWVVSLRDEGFLDPYRRMLKKHPFVGVLDMWYADLVTSTAGYSVGYPESSGRYGEPIGPGRAITSDALEHVEWLPRPSGRKKGHDGPMRRKLEGAGFSAFGYPQDQFDIRIVDIKSELSMTSYECLTLSQKSWQEVFEPFPRDEFQELQTLCQSHGY
jgi:glycosyltransferase involved in cell wall biosynthesis